jgi:hypothetical protein
MSTPGALPKPEMRKSFAAGTPTAARLAASAWLGDFAAHGPLDLRSIRVVEEGDAFAAVVTYREMEVETTPRHFGNEPVRLPRATMPLLKSA